MTATEAGPAPGAEDIPPFDLCGPLPIGVTVLEASAGTGKTFTIAALAARYVASGIPLANMLLVTFTRMATGELRARVRERLVTAEDGLARAQAGVAPPVEDEVLCLLAEGTPAEVALRRQRLATALRDFDTATIATTHGFCEHVLSGFGVAGDVERDVTFVEDLGDLVEEIVDDFYIRKFCRADGIPPFDRAEALRIARKAVDNPFSPLEPRDAPEGSTPDIRRRLAEAVRIEVERRKRRAGVLTYDDLLVRLRNTLDDPARGAAACERLRARYWVALVDEFQDTDPIQWEVMRRAFGAGAATLVLIGDPKQAIYAFRGADVYAYLDAARTAGVKATLDVNWRSDKALLDGYDTVFGGAKLGHESIPYRRVAAAKAHQEPRLIDAPVGAALRLRIVRRDSKLVHLTDQGYVSVAHGREHVAADLAGDLVRLLSSPAKIVVRGPDGAVVAGHPLRPGDVAVLVRTNRHAAVVRDALAGVGIPAVINGAGSVFATPTAREWLRLLEALERPTSSTRAASVALTSFLGWTAEQVASADDPAWEDVHARLHQWAGLLRRRGVASLLEAVTHAEGLPGRVLARPDGERELTDVRHTGQLLHAAATTDQLGVTALAAWLRQRIAEADRDTGNEERSRRLESDAEAVQVLTIHRSKGLEFPVVYYPYLWDPSWISDNDPPIYHEPAAGNERSLDVGGKRGPNFAKHWDRYVREQRGEELRLAYVALTRAQHQAVVWWAGSYDSRDSPLGRLLFSREADGTVAAAGARVPPDDEVSDHVSALAARTPGCISVERSSGIGRARWTGGPRPRADLAAGRFGRELDARWRRTSYSGITVGAHDGHDARVGSEAEQETTSDEAEAVRPAEAPGDVVTADRDETALRSMPAPLAEMPGGREVGTFVHSVLEATDFAAAYLKDDLAAAIGREQRRQRIDIGDPTTVAEGLRLAIETPLGPLLDEIRLCDIGKADRVNEMVFELPLVGGDHPTAELTVLAIGSLLRQHLPAGDPLAAYADRLADPTLAGDLRGFLTGSLDLVLRTRGPDGNPRFAVVDYKTNRLAAPGEGLTAWHYRPEALMEEMQRAHYPLQAVLYLAALHRYLRWRLPGYDPEHNLAGVFYLFVRGMGGAASPRIGSQPCGVFAWRPPTAFIEALSDLLDRGSVAA
jgi:exodeoxyribonuclease V beta subunit